MFDNATQAMIVLRYPRINVRQEMHKRKGQTRTFNTLFYIFHVEDGS
uniref:Uncharacterized protein n=1 Tax=Arundo donax TaxID=35708 RepID=A0A0A9E9P4_ARUDO